jgi:DNA-binding NarL/FixJ family response regulator
MTNPVPRVVVVVLRGTNISSLRSEDIDSLDIVEFGSDVRADPPEGTVPDVLLIDVTFPNNRSIDAIRNSRDEYPEVAILALAQEPISYELTVLAIEEGAQGFVVVSDVPVRCTPWHESVLGAHRRRTSRSCHRSCHSSCRSSDSAQSHGRRVRPSTTDHRGG